MRHTAKTRWARMGVPLCPKFFALIWEGWSRLHKTRGQTASCNFILGGGQALLLPVACLLLPVRGGVAEWLKAPVLKTGVHFVDREFESRPLRQ